MSRNSYVASSHCPSHDWDRYCDSQEVPEECPVCGAENSKMESGHGPQWVCDEAPGFCSVKCAEEYKAEQKRLDEAQAQEYFAEQKQIAEHNAKCPQCKGSEKYCFCPTNPDNQEG